MIIFHLSVMFEICISCQRWLIYTGSSDTQYNEILFLQAIPSHSTKIVQG